MHVCKVEININGKQHDCRGKSFRLAIENRVICGLVRCAASTANVDWTNRYFYLESVHVRVFAIRLVWLSSRSHRLYMHRSIGSYIFVIADSLKVKKFESTVKRSTLFDWRCKNASWRVSTRAKCLPTVQPLANIDGINWLVEWFMTWRWSWWRRRRRLFFVYLRFPYEGTSAGLPTVNEQSFLPIYYARSWRTVLTLAVELLPK